MWRFSTITGGGRERRWRHRVAPKRCEVLSHRLADVLATKGSVEGRRDAGCLWTSLVDRRLGGDSRLGGRRDRSANGGAVERGTCRLTETNLGYLFVTPKAQVNVASVPEFLDFATSVARAIGADARPQ